MIRVSIERVLILQLFIDFLLVFSLSICDNFLQLEHKSLVVGIPVISLNFLAVCPLPNCVVACSTKRMIIYGIQENQQNKSRCLYMDILYTVLQISTGSSDSLARTIISLVTAFCFYENVQYCA